MAGNLPFVRRSIRAVYARSSPPRTSGFTCEDWALRNGKQATEGIAICGAPRWLSWRIYMDMSKSTPETLNEWGLFILALT